MTYPDLPPADRAPSEGQQPKPAYFGFFLVFCGGAIVGAFAGRVVLGAIDLWSEKFRPELRPSIRSLLPYFYVGGAIVCSVLALILVLIPGGSNKGKDKERQSPGNK